MAAKDRVIGVVGLGYVGLPVAASFAAAGFRVVGYDLDPSRVAELGRAHDRTGEVEPERLRAASLRATSDAAELAGADFFIVTVPTPIDAARRPDLSALLSASVQVGRALKRGDVVVYESTVYPGATEEDCLPVLERESGLKGGADFTVGYSPERINPGDREHRFETIAKVVSGQDGPTLDLVAEVYGAVVRGGIHRAPSIRVAEAAKVIENAQRDLNIAFMNELSIIFARLGIDTGDVLAAARTKWNFLPFTPGLVGGHCIGVDPYYLTHRAEMAGCHPEVILAGRRVNDGVGPRIARDCIRWLLAQGRARPRVTILGLTFKENVPDVRNSKVFDIVAGLRDAGIEVTVHDPLALPADAARHGVELVALDGLPAADAVVLATPHAAYRERGWGLVTVLLKEQAGLVYDVKGVLDRTGAPEGVDLVRL